MPRRNSRPEGPSSAVHSSSSSSRSPSPSPPSSPPAPSSSSLPPPSSQAEDQPETPHEAVSRRVPTRPWNEKDEAHRLSLHHLTYSDARFNPPPPSLWKRLALVGLCVVLVWLAFSARLGMWERKKAVGRRVWAERAAGRLAKENAVPIAQARMGGEKTRPTVIPSFETATRSRDEI